MTVIISIACCCPLLYGQTKDVAIKSIRETVRKINIDKTLKTVKLENEQITDQMPDGGCSLTGYIKGSTICKMDFWAGFSNCIRQYSLYLNNKGEPVFIYETERDFPKNKQGGLDYNKTVPAFEGRYYLQNGKTIDVKLKGKKRMGENPLAKDISDLLSNVESYKKLLSGQIKR
ncbi:MAG: hypothetical protein ABI113_21555 [Mucilaginibacter sp.]